MTGGEAVVYDPLRIRPYVALPSMAEPDPAGPPPEALSVGAQGAQPQPFAPPPEADDTQKIGYSYELTAPTAAPRRNQPVRRRGPGVFIAAAAVVGVLATAAYAGGLLTGDDGDQDRAVPDIETLAPFLSAGPDPSVSASASKKSGASPSAALSPSGTASASARANSSPPIGVADAPASPSATVRATGQVSRGPATPEGITLGPGDSGAEVVELQERLDQLWMSRGPSHGRYDGRVENAVAAYQQDRGITGDPVGVYGPETRRALEAETEYPYDGWDGDEDWDGGGGHGGRG
ncbi:peptidoglycan-binding protein [Streptomyces sp. NPDC057445]|uniref:peptidoglycan-binding domain-containing protein n=1 Tax=Streptomyces sp. NPDC057445 TaxID=3346136 RepID=UPI00368FA3C8